MTPPQMAIRGRAESQAQSPVPGCPLPVLGGSRPCLAWQLLTVQMTVNPERMPLPRWKASPRQCALGLHGEPEMHLLVSPHTHPCACDTGQSRVTVQQPRGNGLSEQ